MEHNFGAADGRRNGAGIANVRLVPFDAGTNFFEVRSMPRKQVVDHAHLAVALREQGADHCRADKTSAAGDDVTRHLASPPVWWPPPPVSCRAKETHHRSAS